MVLTIKFLRKCSSIITFSALLVGCQNTIQNRSAEDLIVTNKQEKEDTIFRKGTIVVQDHIQESVRDKKYLIRLNMSAHSKYRLVIGNYNQVKFSVNGDIITTEKRAEVTLLYEKLMDSLENSVIRISYERFYVSLKDKAGEEEIFDTQKQPEERDRIETILASVVGKSIQMVIDKSGHIIRSDGRDEIVKNTLEVARSGESPEIGAVAYKLVEQLLGNESLKSSFEQNMSVFPDTAIYTGTTWKEKMVQYQGFQYATDNIFTFDKIDGGDAYISAEGKISNANNTTQLNTGESVYSNLNGKQTNKIVIDTKTGFLKNVSSDATLSGTISVQARQVPVEIHLTKKIAVKAF